MDENGRGKPGSVYEFTKIFQEKAKEVFSLKHLDLANNGIPNRLRKMPYSLVGDNVALPLTLDEFKFWRLEDMHHEKVMRNKRLKDRGIPLVTSGETTKILKDKVLLFIREFGLK